MHSDTPIILAPTPRRHLIESSASQHWLNTPPMSPLSSRQGSPPPAVPQPNSSSTTHVRRRFPSHLRSFSALLEGERQQARHISPSAHTYSNTSRVTGKAYEPEERAMGREWIRWMHKRAIKHWVVPTILAVSTLVKFAIGLGSYSGGYMLKRVDPDISQV
jgi:alpha-1,3-glucosyltransferase